MSLDNQVAINMMVQVVVEKALSDNIQYLKIGLDHDNVDFELIGEAAKKISGELLDECIMIDKGNGRNIFTLIIMIMLHSLLKTQEREFDQLIKDKGISKEMLYQELALDALSYMKKK